MNLQVQFHSFWHVGTGKGQGTRADAIVMRNTDGLPFVPGTVLRGILRDAARLAQEAGYLGKDSVESWFGSDLAAGNSGDDAERALEEQRYVTEPGEIRISAATLGENWSWWASKTAHELDSLFRLHASTKIEDGQAADHSLRTIEMVVPMTLQATVNGLQPDAEESFSTYVLPFVRSLGSYRNRGFGRVSLTAGNI